MPIDTSINRASPSDSTSAFVRKKSNTEAIEVSKLSFFDELLSISQFASTIPNAPALPPLLPLASEGTQSSESHSETVDKASGEKPDEDDPIDDASEVATVQLIVPQQAAIQPTIQTPHSDVKSNKPKPASPIQGTAKRDQVQQGGTQDASDASNSIKSDVQASNEEVNTDLQNLQALDLQSEVDSNVAGDSLPSGIDAQGDEDEGREPELSTDDPNKSQPIRKGRASSDASEDNRDESNTGPDISSLTPVQSEGKDVTGKNTKDLQPNAEQVEQTNQFDDAAIDADQPRNRRSERLAELASSSDSSSDERDQSSDTSLSLDSSGTTAANGIEREASFISATTVATPLPPATTITPNLSPGIPNLNTLSNTSASPSTNARSATDGVSAVTASATGSGSQTSAAISTISGTTPTSSRPGAPPSEVARSNSGTQISAYQEGKLVQRVLRGVEQLANGGGQVRLRLHPAELGSLQISLKVEAGQVSAKLEVENATARDALLNNVQTLKDRLAEQGIKVASFEVDVSTDSSGSGTANSSFQGDGRSNGQAYRDNAESRFALQNNTRRTDDTNPPARTQPAAWTRNTGSLDLTV